MDSFSLNPSNHDESSPFMNLMNVARAPNAHFMAFENDMASYLTPLDSLYEQASTGKDMFPDKNNVSMDTEMDSDTDLDQLLNDENLFSLFEDQELDQIPSEEEWIQPMESMLDGQPLIMSESKKKEEEEDDGEEAKKEGLKQTNLPFETGTNRNVHEEIACTGLKEKTELKPKKTKKRRALRLRHKVAIMRKLAHELETEFRSLFKKWTSCAMTEEVRAAAVKELLAKWERRKVEQTNAMLRENITKQQQVINNLTNMFVACPVNKCFNLTDYMHCYIHLGKDLEGRERLLKSFAEAKLDLAYNLAQREMSDVNTHNIYTEVQHLDMGEQNVSTRKFVWRIQGVKLEDTFDAVWEYFSDMDVIARKESGEVVERETFESFKNAGFYRKLGFNIPSLHPKKNSVDFESRTLYYSKRGKDFGVFTLDYIDEDDLYPFEAEKKIRRDVTLVLTLTQKYDEKNNPYVNYQRIQTLKYSGLPENSDLRKHEEIEELCTFWDNLMVKCIKEKLGVE